MSDKSAIIEHSWRPTMWMIVGLEMKGMSKTYYDDVRRINDFVQFVPDTFALSFQEDGFFGKLGAGARVPNITAIFPLGLSSNSCSRQQLEFFESFQMRCVFLLTIGLEILEGSDIDFRLLTLCFRSEGVWRRLVWIEQRTGCIYRRNWRSRSSALLGTA